MTECNASVCPFFESTGEIVQDYATGSAFLNSFSTKNVGDETMLHLEFHVKIFKRNKPDEFVPGVIDIPMSIVSSYDEEWLENWFDEKVFEEWVRIYGSIDSKYSHGKNPDLGLSNFIQNKRNHFRWKHQECEKKYHKNRSEGVIDQCVLIEIKELT